MKNILVKTHILVLWFALMFVTSRHAQAAELCEGVLNQEMARLALGAVDKEALGVGLSVAPGHPEQGVRYFRPLPHGEQAVARVPTPEGWLIRVSSPTILFAREQKDLLLNVDCKITSIHLVLDHTGIDLDPRICAGLAKAERMPDEESRSLLKTLAPDTYWTTSGVLIELSRHICTIHKDDLAAQR